MATKSKLLSTALPESATPKDWKVFQGQTNTAPHLGLAGLPLPPWRHVTRTLPVSAPDLPPGLLAAEQEKAEPFLPDDKMIWAVNAALYLRRPLLLTGKPGSGKSTLISKVAHELKLGPVLRWDITSRSTVRSGIYEYDAIGRLQEVQKNKGRAAAAGTSNDEIAKYLSLGPLGTAMLGSTWPRALLVDEIDKGDLDLANDLLNVIEEGTYDIPELRRLGDKRTITIRDRFNRPAPITGGKIECRQFPFVVMTSNAEREFPPPFLRRCVRLTVNLPDEVTGMEKIVRSHLKKLAATPDDEKKLTDLITKFLGASKESELATDQLLNAVFLTMGMDGAAPRTFSDQERTELQKLLMVKLA